jgi:tripartite-type tricarboxylate transporter receptor subunit TctC
MLSQFRNLAVLAGLALAAVSAAAQPYPSRPVRIIVPASAGGVLDMMARAISQGLSEPLGQPFVAEARAGANGIIGAEIVAKAAPDGHVLLFTAASVFSNNPFLYERLPYDAAKSFAPIGMCCVMAQAVVVNPALNVNSLREFVERIKSAPGRLVYGSIGRGSTSNIFMEELKRLAGIDMLHVPYKGSTPAVTDLLANRVSAMVVTLGVIQGHLRAGRLKALAVGSSKRSSVFPDVPTAAEAGFPAWNAEVWMGLFAPADTPREVVSRLNIELGKLIRSQEFNEQWLRRNGFDLPHVETPEQFAEFIRADMQNSGRTIKAAGIKLD